MSISTPSPPASRPESPLNSGTSDDRVNPRILSPTDDPAHGSDTPRTPSPIAGPSNQSPPPSPVFGPRNWHPTDQYEMKFYKPVHSKLLKTTAGDYKINIKPFESNDFTIIQQRLEAVIDSVLDKSREKAVSNAKGKISVWFPGLENHINIRFDDIWKITGKDLLTVIEKVVNSNQKVSLDEFCLHVVFTEMPTGGNGRGERFEDRTILEKADWVRNKKRALLNVSKDAGEDDMMCLAR